MKKLALLIALMLITAFTFAQVDMTITGESELVFGVSLDSEASGFTNTNKSKVAFTLGTDTSVKGEEEGVYGFIEIKEWKVSSELEGNDVDEASELKIDTGEITAKIMFPGGWVKISGTNDEINYINVPIEEDTANDTDDKGLAISIGNSGGLVLGINAGPAAIEVGVFSVNDWTETEDATGAVYTWSDVDGDPLTSADAGWVLTTPAVPEADDLNNENEYGASLKATIDVAPAKIELGVIAGLYTDATLGFGGKVTVDMAPVTVYAGGDVDATDIDNLLLEIGGGVDVALMDGVSIGADVVYNDGSDYDMDVTLTFSEDSEGGLVDGLGVGIELLLDNAMDATESTPADELKYVAELYLDYLVPDTMKPYLTFGYGDFSKKDSGNVEVAGAVTLPSVNDASRAALLATNAYLSIGVELLMITNVVIKAEYSNDTLLDAADVSVVGQKGTITLSTKIAY